MHGWLLPALEWIQQRQQQMPRVVIFCCQCSCAEANQRMERPRQSELEQLAALSCSNPCSASTVHESRPARYALPATNPRYSSASSSSHWCSSRSSSRQASRWDRSDSRCSCITSATAGHTATAPTSLSVCSSHKYRHSGRTTRVEQLTVNPLTSHLPLLRSSTDACRRCHPG